MTYRTTRRADQDIIDIYVYGATNSASSRPSVVKTFETLSVNPLMARERAEIDPPVRLHPYR